LWIGTHVPWTWYVALGTIVTFATGYAASLALPAEEQRSIDP